MNTKRLRVITHIIEENQLVLADILLELIVLGKLLMQKKFQPWFF